MAGTEQELNERLSANGAAPAASNVRRSGTMRRWGAALGGSALTIFGLRRRSPGGLALALAGGMLTYRGLSGGGLAGRAAEHGIEIKTAVTVNAARADVYRFWRQLENLPRFMRHLESVDSADGGRSHWRARWPGGLETAWDAEVTAERESELLAWRSLPDADVENEGQVRFVEAPGGRGTEVHALIVYRPPAGRAGAAIAALLNDALSLMIREDLRRFKQIMETGEIATVEGQPTGGGSSEGGGR